MTLRARPGLALLVLARAVTNVGNGIAPIALAFGLLARSDQGVTAVSIVIAAQAVGALILMPAAGVVGDRFGRARVIAVSEFAMALTAAALGACFISGYVEVWLIACLAAIGGALAALWWPAFAAIVPLLVPEHRLESANGALAVATTGGMVTGNLIAGVAIATWGPGPALLIDALTFLIAGVCVSRVSRDLPHATRVSPVKSSGHELSDGWSWFVRHRWLAWSSLAFGVVIMAWRASKEVLGPALFEPVANGPTKWAIVVAAQTLGLLLGAVIAMRYRSRSPARAFLLLVVGAAWMLALALNSGTLLLLAISLAAGVAIGFFEVVWFSMLHRAVPQRMLARIASIQSIALLALGPFGLALAGPLARAVGLPTALVITAAVAALGVASGVIALRSVPGFTQQHDQPRDDFPLRDSSPTA